MSRMIYIIDDNDVFNKDVIVDENLAAKMLEVYDKVQLFKPVKVDASTVVGVENDNIFINMNGASRIFFLSKSEQLRNALFAAEQYIKSHKN